MGKGVTEAGLGQDLNCDFVAAEAPVDLQRSGEMEVALQRCSKWRQED